MPQELKGRQKHSNGSTGNFLMRTDFDTFNRQSKG